ncbi:MAG: LLM class flavin-dependent oxidoreductase [Candidatus Binatia bacterium]
MHIGLFSNGERGNQVARISYEEDLHEVIVADEHGIPEAWISEHGTFVGYQSPDQLPCADPFICKAAALTKQIRMGPGIRPLPYFHPLQVATDLTMEYMIDRGAFFCGDADTVYHRIKNLYDEIGGFGVLLLLAGKDWGGRAQRERSMRRFMTEVAPRLANLNPDVASVSA